MGLWRRLCGVDASFGGQYSGQLRFHIGRGFVISCLRCGQVRAASGIAGAGTVTVITVIAVLFVSSRVFFHVPVIRFLSRIFSVGGSSASTIHEVI